MSMTSLVSAMRSTPLSKSDACNEKMTTFLMHQAYTLGLGDVKGNLDDS